MATTVAYRPPPLYDYQVGAMFHEARYGLIEAAPQVGKTHTALAWFIEQALLSRPRRVGWWVSSTYALAKVAYDRAKYSLPTEFARTNDTTMTIHLANDVRIQFKSADHPKPLFAETVDFGVADEASLWKQESWGAFRGRFARTEGPMRIIGNKFGRGWFWSMCRRAEAGEPNMRFTKMAAPDAVAAGILSQEEVDDAKVNMPDAMFRELYLLEDVDDGNPFGYQAIDACVAPLSTNPPKVFGVDLAKAVDWTVVIGMDTDGAVCRYERWQRIPWLGFTHFKRRKRGNLQVGGIERWGVPACRGWLRTVKNPLTPATGGVAPGRWRPRRLAMACRTRPPCVGS